MMVLNNVKITGSEQSVSIRIHDCKIAAMANSPLAGNNSSPVLTFNDAMIFPGLVNSHDHLDFNLFCPYGDRVYNNYTEWGVHVHQQYRDEIAAVLKVPAALRYHWGVYKNLLAGVTTVVNHGKPSGMGNDLITVFEKTQSLHSVRLEKYWKIKLNNPGNFKLPVTIHVGEGTDAAASREIDQLISWNLLKRKLIGIHAVAMTAVQARNFCAVVWCPESNFFLLNKTAAINILREQTTILFGTDSTLTGNWNIWDHLQLAKKTRLLDDDELYDALNKNAAKTWKLNCGEIAVGRDADLMIAKTTLGNSLDTFFSLGPADLLLVMHQGNIRLFDESLLKQLGRLDLNNFSKIRIDGVCKYVQGDLPALIKRIREYNPAINFPVGLN